MRSRAHSLLLLLAIAVLAAQPATAREEGAEPSAFRTNADGQSRIPIRWLLAWPGTR